ncbi:hydroxylamine reductase [bacterium]|nr:hydroxylamine reductase [bacterium]
MFCYQCEQTAKGTGCTIQGVCGKDDTTATLQDVLIFTTASIAYFAKALFASSNQDEEINHFIIESLFTTITNVNFDPERLMDRIRLGVKLRERLMKRYLEGGFYDQHDNDAMTSLASKEIPTSLEDCVRFGKEVSLTTHQALMGEERAGLLHMILYGLKGVSAYADHAKVLGKEDPAVYTEFYRLLSVYLDREVSLEALLGYALEVGKLNYRVMALLMQANTEAYGHPEPTKVRTTPVIGKAILVSGHDLLDLEAILQQSEGKGINVYTHGEMLPTHSYPGLKKYPHFAGHYGTAWQNQQIEFPDFPGPIVMTTNCIQRPRDSYMDRIFTSGLVAFPGVKHIENRDFSPVIDKALATPGFTEMTAEKTITVGFGYNAVMNVADKVLDLVKSGKINHFYLIGGCDGAKPGRSYYTDFAVKAPKDSIILTLACGKFRFNQLDFGDIDGIPRLLDVGQCNDAYSAIQIALSLAKALNTDIHHLPISYIISWYEQKAVAILLTLLSLGIQDIHLGPTLPAFVKPSVLNVLVDTFHIKPITTPEQDMAA